MDEQTMTAKLAQVRRILAKAEHPTCPPPEAEALTAKAATLIAKYGIDAALLAESVPEADVVGDRVIVLAAPYALDKRELLTTVARQLRCRTVWRVGYPDGRTKEISAHLFGFGADLERAEMLYTSLLVQSGHALAVHPVPVGEHPAAYRRSWYAGFTAAVGVRLSAAEREAASCAQTRRDTEAPGGRSVALVLADRQAVAERALREAYPRMGTPRGRQLSGSGMGSGWAAGQRADIGARRVRGGRTRVLGR